MLRFRERRRHEALSPLRATGAGARCEAAVAGGATDGAAGGVFVLARRDGNRIARGSWGLGGGRRRHGDAVCAV